MGFIDYLNKMDTVQTGYDDDDDDDDVVDTFDGSEKELNNQDFDDDLVQRLRIILDQIGLKSVIIDDVIYKLMGGGHDIIEPLNAIKSPVQIKSKSTVPIKTNRSVSKPTPPISIINIADDILEGVSEMSYNNDNNNDANTTLINNINISSVADRASSLLS